MTMTVIRDEFGRALKDAGALYPELFAVTADLMYPTRANMFRDAYPDRFVDVGIQEQNMTGVAAGLATCGKIPVICSYANFTALRTGEQIRDDIAYTNQNVKIAALSSGLTFGPGGATHQSYEDISMIRAIPNMTVLVPSDAKDTRNAVMAAVKHVGPVYLRIGRIAEYDIPDTPDEFVIGKATQLREGNDIAILAMGPMVYEAVTAADILREKGIQARVLNMSTIKPFDNEAALRAATECRAIISVEEHNIIGGLYSCICEAIGGKVACPVIPIGLNDIFPDIGPTYELRKYLGLHHENIVAKAMEALG